MDETTVLVCDDDREIVDAIEIYLSQDGYKIYKAYDGEQAIQILDKEDIHLLIMDIMMPVMGGLEATHMIRTMDHPDSDKVPIIAISANAFDEDQRMAYEAGVDEYLIKPVESKQLYKALHSIKNP